MYKEMKIFNRLPLKKDLMLTGAGALVAVSVINTKLASADYDRNSSSLLTLEALADGESGSGGSENGCLINQNPVKGNKKEITNYRCYQDRPGPDLYCGIVVECEAQTSSSTTCTSRVCTGSGCYRSSQMPKDPDNY
jgi:hypothetical protein